MSTFTVSDIETDIDGLKIKAKAYRNFKTHRVEIYSPFEYSKIGADIWLMAVPHYQKLLKTRDLYQDSVELVHEAYREYIQQ